MFHMELLMESPRDIGSSRNFGTSAAVKAFLSDLVAVTAYYQSHLKEARQALLDAKLVGLPPQVYFNVPDYVRDPGLRPNIENMTKQQDVLVSSGFQEKPADLKAVVDPSYLPGH